MQFRIIGPIRPLIAISLGAPIAIVAGPSSTAVQAHARVGVLGPEEPRVEEIVKGLRQGLDEHGYARGTLEILEGRKMVDRVMQ